MDCSLHPRTGRPAGAQRPDARQCHLHAGRSRSIFLHLDKIEEDYSADITALPTLSFALPATSPLEANEITTPPAPGRLKSTRFTRNQENMKKRWIISSAFFHRPIPNARAHGNFSRNEELEPLRQNYPSHRARDK